MPLNVIDLTDDKEFRIYKECVEKILDDKGVDVILELIDKGGFESKDIMRHHWLKFIIMGYFAGLEHCDVANDIYDSLKIAYTYFSGMGVSETKH